MNFLRSYTMPVIAALLVSNVAVAQHTTMPDPVAEIGGKSQGVMAASAFKMQVGPLVSIKGGDEHTERFQVTSFQFSIAPKHGQSVGPFIAGNPYGTRFSDNKNIVDAIKELKPGDKVMIENIKAIGPNHKNPVLNPIILTMN